MGVLTEHDCRGVVCDRLKEAHDLFYSKWAPASMSTRLDRMRDLTPLVILAIATLVYGCTSGAQPTGPGSSVASSSTPSATSPSATSPSATSPASAASQPANGSISWTLVPSTGLGTASVADVIATSAGFVAVGYVNENGHTNGGIWTSSDGTTWDRVTVAASDESFLRVAAAGSAYVAISVHCAPGAGECSAPSSWTSTDAKTWTEHVIDSCCSINDITATAQSVVAVGADLSTGFPATPADAAAFVSTDGAKWTRAKGDQTFKQASMGAVGTLGSGYAVLGTGQTSMIAWTSADGATWTGAPPSESLHTADASDMASLPDLLVSVGRDGSEAVSWTSADGTAWTRSAKSASTDNAAMSKVTGAGAYLVAVGHDSTGAGAIWSSTDGLTWTRASSLPGAASGFSAVAANENQIVVFGSTTFGAAVLLVGAL